MKPIVILVLLLCLSTTLVFGQIKIGDNPQNIDASSVLELESTSKVLVITRVTTSQMDGITPQHGGMVYNTDTECIHYFDGTEWINLCDAVSFSLTNDPIENITSTISIVNNGNTINLEVAPNSIRSENIVDGGINGDDIQDNSIGESKLGADSVSANELRDNSVSSTEIVDGTIRPVDMANAVPNQILTTDATGIVNWVDASDVREVVTDPATITGTGIAGDVLAVSDAVQNAISVNALNIAEHIGTDMDTDDRNELTDLSYDAATNTLSLTRSDVGTAVNLDALNNAGTDNQNLNLTATNVLEIERGNTVDLNLFLDNTDAQELGINGNIISISGGNQITLPAGTVDTDNQRILGGAVVGNDLRIDIEDGTSGLIDISSLIVTGSDNQNITGGAIIGNDLRIDIEDGTSGLIDISSLIVTGSDNQNIIGGAIIGNDLRIDIEDGTSGLIDISALTGTGTDSQNLTGATLSPTNILQINIQNGNSTTVDLNSLAGAGTQNLASVLTNGSSAGNLQINDVADPTLPQDAATKKYVDDSVVASGGGVPTDELNQIFEVNGLNLELTDAAGTLQVPLADIDTDNQNLESAILTDSDLDINIEGGNNVTADLSTLATDAELLAAITASETLDDDTSITNEIQPVISSDGSVGIAANGIGFDLSVTDGGTDDQNLESAILTGSNLDINIEGGNDVTADLSALTTDAELLAAITASETLDDDTSITNEIQPVISSDGSVGISANGIGFDLSVAGGSTDDQNLESAILTGSDLDINIEGGNNVTADLSTLATDAELLAAITASETLDDDTSITNEIQPVISSDGSVGIAANGIGFDLSVAEISGGPGGNIAPNSITQGDIGPGSIGPNEIQSDAVSSDEIEDGTVLNDDIGFGVAGSKIIPDFGAQNIITTGGLSVGGDILLNGNAVVPDYVFQKYFTGSSVLNETYKFKSLQEIETFVKQNQHLPGVKSAEEVKEEGFWNLGEASKINLEKIEELFLHTIEQEKKISELKQTNETMATEMELLKTQLEEIKKIVLAQDKN